jgi:hypothetical protein
MLIELGRRRTDKVPCQLVAPEPRPAGAAHAAVVEHEEVDAVGGVDAREVLVLVGGSAQWRCSFL